MRKVSAKCKSVHLACWRSYGRCKTSHPKRRIQIFVDSTHKSCRIKVKRYEAMPTIYPSWVNHNPSQKLFLALPTDPRNLSQYRFLDFSSVISSLLRLYKLTKLSKWSLSTFIFQFLYLSYSYFTTVRIMYCEEGEDTSHMLVETIIKSVF